jgi:hypothetical protein
MTTRRKMWQMLSSLSLIAAVANRAAAAPAASPTGGPGMEMLTIFFATTKPRLWMKSTSTRDRAPSLGRLSHRVLSNLRLSSDL